MANLFLSHYEGEWLENYHGNKPLFYKRYVDDVLAVFNNENDAKAFLTYLNDKHPNIKFTLELETNNRLPFLDVLLDKSENLVTSIYRKKTFSGVLTNYFSFTPMRYKIGLVKCLIDRVFKVNNTWVGFDKDLKEIFKILKRNAYPEQLINKITKSYSVHPNHEWYLLKNLQNHQDYNKRP